MKIVKFEGASMREALAKVKRELGDDAVVVSTREIRRGLVGTAIEVSAAIEDSGPSAAQNPLGPQSRLPPALAEEDLERAIGPLRAELRSLRSLLRASTDTRPSSEMRAEMQEMRKLLEAVAAGTPAAGALRAKPPEAPPSVSPTAPLAEVARQFPIAAPSQGRVIALVGPTGVGKTTTIAKLAARAALVDERSVAIVTLDNYRVGGQEQIAIFADLIGVPLHCISHPDELAACIESLAGLDLVLIDTAGRSPRDHAAIADLAHGLRAIGDLEVHVVLAAATAPATIDELIARYRILEPSRMLFTKVDEASALDELVRAPARHALPLSYVTTGQAVPEDLEAVSGPRLLELALRGLDERATLKPSTQPGPRARALATARVSA